MKRSYFLTKRQRYDDLKAQLDADYNTFRPQYQELNDYFLPTRGRFQLSMDSNRGDKRNNKIIDPTGYLCARTLGSGMHAGITSPARPWKRLSTSNPALAEVGPVREWLDIVDQEMTTYFLRSNLYNVLPVSYVDLGVFGTAAIFMDKDKDTIANFMSFPLGSYRIARNFRGQVNVFFREYRLTVRQLIEEFGNVDPVTGEPDMSVFSQQVKNLYDKEQFETWVEICWVIEPNDRFNPNMLDAKFKRFSSCWYERGSSEVNSDGESKFLRESGFDFFPVLVLRWQVTGQDVYGTDCPGMIALGDNKQLQHGEKKGARAIDKMIDPALKASANLKKTRASIVSGDITYLEEPTDVFEAVHKVEINISHLDAKQEQIRGRLKKSFMTDVFMPFLNDERNQPRTALEVSQIGQERLLAVGPVLERIDEDGLNLLIDNMFFLMNEAGLIPPAPPELQGQALKVEFISIMASAQKATGLQSLDSLLRVATALNALDPSVLQKFDAHEYMDQYADGLGVSPRVIRSDDKVAEMQAQAQQAQQQAQTLANVGQVAKTAKDLSQADTSNPSLLSSLLEQAKAGQIVPQ